MSDVTALLIEIPMAIEEVSCPYCGAAPRRSCRTVPDGSPYPAPPHGYTHEARRFYRDGVVEGMQRGLAKAIRAIEAVSEPDRLLVPDR